MKIVKIKRIFNPEDFPKHKNLLSHSSNPLPIKIGKNEYRIFYSGRDKNNRSSIGAFDYDLKLLKVTRTFKEPFFSFDANSSYFYSGISLGGYYEYAGVQYFLFMGWQNDEINHWRGDIGRLMLDKNLNLSLKDNKPLISVDRTDPLSFSYPFILNLEKGLRMWYGSTLSWEKDNYNNEMIHVINSAFSSDGENWTKEGLAIPYEMDICQAFSRPSLIKNEDNSFSMFFSYRGNKEIKYRIGYAYSKDSLNWDVNLKPEGLDISESGWDSEMIEYPYVFEHDSKRYLLFNGNGYGKTGIGIAEVIGY